MSGLKRPFALAIPVSLALILSSCSVWDEITAYFNTFYNAQRLFTEAEDEIWALPDLRYTGKNELVPFTVPAGAKTKLTSVIEKCSKLLLYHPESGLIDDALMMVGKSYYYQGDFQAASRKFNELIDQYPESDFVLEARYLLAASQYRLGKRVEADQLARDLIARAEEEGEDEVVANAEAVLGHVAYDNADYATARGHFLKTASDAALSDRRAFAFIKVAEIDSLLGNYASARESYLDAANVGTNYLVEYRGLMGLARMYAREEEYGDALDGLEALRYNAKFKDFLGEIDLEIGNVYRDQGETDEAIQQYRFVDTSYVRTEASANAIYQLGLTYERSLMFDSARSTYNRGRTVAPSAKVTPSLARRADYMNRLFSIRADIARYDSLLRVLQTVKKAPADSARADSSAAQPSQVAQSDSARGAPVKPAPPSVAPAGGLSADTLDARLAMAKNEMATLFYLTMNLPDSAEAWYRDVIAHHPTSPVVPRAMFSLAEIMSRDTLGESSSADSLYREIIQEYPNSVYAAEARRILGLEPQMSAADTAGVDYHAAEALYLSGDYTQAVSGYRSVVETYPASTYAPRAQYAVGWLYEQYLDLPDSAAENYRRLMTSYPGSVYATRVEPKVREVDRYRKAVADSLAAEAKKLQEEQARADSVKAAADTTQVPLVPEEAPDMKVDTTQTPQAPVDTSKGTGRP